MARPNKKDEDKKPHRITIRFGDQEEYAKICSGAEAIGVTVSKFIREKIMRGFIRVPKYTKIDARNIALLSKLSGLFKKSYTDTCGVFADKTAAILDEIISLMLKKMYLFKVVISTSFYECGQPACRTVLRYSWI